MDAPINTTDPRLAYMVEVMEGSRKLLATTYAGLHRVDHVAGQVQKNATVYEWEVLAAARGLLQEAIKTLVSVHDALQRAERMAYPLPVTVTPTHWMPLPEPPEVPE